MHILHVADESMGPAAGSGGAIVGWCHPLQNEKRICVEQNSSIAEQAQLIQMKREAQKVRKGHKIEYLYALCLNSSQRQYKREG